jgi:monoamine oxidase
VAAPGEDVIVVGAGMAGLACAHRLAQAGANCLVLESSDRVGGRVWTDYSIADGAPVETGALMVHGRHVATHAWIRELGLGTRRLPVLQRTAFLRERQIASFPWMGLPFHPTFGMRAIYQVVWRIPRALRHFDGPDTTFADYLDRTHAVPGARSLGTLLHAHINAADPEDIGVRGLGEEEARSSEGWYRHFQLVQGYSELVRRRADPLRNRLRLRTRVTLIRHSDRGVEVRASTPEGDVCFRGGFAVVTLPLGILKAGTVEFDPPLPAAKRHAIGSVAFGSVMETILRLRGGNLVEKLGDFAMIWGGSFTSFDRPFVGLPNRPEILSAFTAGKEAVRRSQMTDAEAVDAAMAELDSILPRGVVVGDVSASLVRRWPIDPNIRGGYSYLPPNSTLRHRVALAAPVENRLFFAGEAMHFGGEQATVHGAIETGYRAANEVLLALRSE